MRKILKKTKKEIRTIISDLDLFSRILIGQYDEMIYIITGVICPSYDDQNLNRSLVNLRSKIIPELNGISMNASLGIWGEKTPLIAMKAYDIQQCIRYVFSYHEHPEGGWTTNFDTPYLHGKWNVTKEQMEEYHSVLNKNHCPEYRSGYVIRNIWSCPVILDCFNDEEGTVNLIIDDPEAEEIITMAQRWKEYVVSEKFFELFSEVIKYYDIEISEEELSKDIKELQTALQNYKMTL